MYHKQGSAFMLINIAGLQLNMLWTGSGSDLLETGLRVSKEEAVLPVSAKCKLSFVKKFLKF